MAAGSGEGSAVGSGGGSVGGTSVGSGAEVGAGGEVGSGVAGALQAVSTKRNASSAYGSELCFIVYLLVETTMKSWICCGVYSFVPKPLIVLSFIIVGFVSFLSNGRKLQAIVNKVGDTNYYR
jgi:hypothetical protein